MTTPIGPDLMQHLDQLIQRDPHLRHIDHQRLVQRAKQDPVAHWDELVEASLPIVYTVALRLADDLRNGPAVAEEAATEVFDALRDDDFAIVRNYVGNGKWPSLLMRLTQNAPVMQRLRRDQERPAARLDTELADQDGSVPVLDANTASLLEQEGEKFVTSLRRALSTLHRNDRLLLGMRFEQDLTLRELDHMFRLGSPERIQSMLDRVLDSLQPLRAVSKAWKLDGAQKHALARVMIRRLFEDSMETPEDQTTAPAVQQR